MSFWRPVRAVAWNTVVFATGVVYFNEAFYSQAVVKGRSMQPTFNPEGSTSEDRVLVDKLSVRLFSLRRGDVVLLRSPDNPNQKLVKRLIGLEGDWLAVPGRPDIEQIPRGRCWVEGDNLQSSRDSYSGLGCIPIALIEGRVTYIVWPPERWGSVPSQPPAARLVMNNAHALSDSWRGSSFD